MTTDTQKKIPKADQAGPATVGAQVIARSEKGLRRGGRHWGPEAVIVPLDELTKDNYEAIKVEPGLVVVEVDLPPAPAPAPAKK